MSIYNSKYITKGTKLFNLGSYNEIKYRSDKRYNRLVIKIDKLVAYVPIEIRVAKKSNKLKEN